MPLYLPSVPLILPVAADLEGDVLSEGNNIILQTVQPEKGGTGATSAIEAQVNIVPMFCEPGNEPLNGYPYYQYASSVLCIGDGASFIGRLQTMRSQSIVIGNSFASGDNCIAMGIMDNFGGKGARVDNSIAIGRQASVGSVNNAGIGGIAFGYLNTILNNFLFSSGNHGIAIGNGNTVNAPTTGSGNLGTALGDTNTVNALQGFAMGKQAASQNYGGLVYASGQFSTVGDAQCGKYPLRVTTTNATPTSLFLNGSSEKLRLQDNQVMKICGEVVAKESGGTKFATWSFQVLVVRGVGAASTVVYTASGANPTTLSVGASNITAQAAPGTASTWVLNISADTTNGGVDIKVTGESGVTIKWFAGSDSAEVIS